jgi:hypothetical protein
MKQKNIRMNGIKNSLTDQLKSSLGPNLSKVEDAVSEGLAWLEGNGGGTKEMYDEKHKEVEAVCMPLLKEAYGQEGAGGIEDMLKNMTPEQRMQFEELAKTKEENKIDELD